MLLLLVFNTDDVLLFNFISDALKLKNQKEHRWKLKQKDFEKYY